MVRGVGFVLQVRFSPFIDFEGRCLHIGQPLLSSSLSNSDIKELMPPISGEQLATSRTYGPRF